MTKSHAARAAAAATTLLFGSTVFAGDFFANALFVPDSARAEEGTAAERAACTPEVLRLCNEFIPDPTAITECLKRNKPRLEPECRAVFDADSKPKKRQQQAMPPVFGR